MIGSTLAPYYRTHISHCSGYPRTFEAGRGAAGSHLKVLVGGFLVFPGHGGWSATGEVAGTTEENSSGTDSCHGVEENLGTLTWGWKSAGSVGAKGNPVGYNDRSVE